MEKDERKTEDITQINERVETLEERVGKLEDVINDLPDSMQQKILENTKRNEVKPISSVIKRTFEEMEIASTRDDELSGIPSGFTSLDRITSGWQSSDLIIVAGSPSIGKTAFALSMARTITVDFNNAPSVLR